MPNRKTKTKIQLSMFPRFVCEICGDKLDHNGTSCGPCAKKWVELQNEKKHNKKC